MKGVPTDRHAVTIDLSWFRSRPTGNEHFPNRFCYVIPDAMSGEIAGLDGSNKAGLVHKFARMLMLNADRTYLVLHSGEILRHELEKQRLTSLDELVNWESTNSFRDGTAVSAQETVRRCTQNPEGLAPELDTKRHEFRKLMESLTTDRKSRETVMTEARRIKGDGDAEGEVVKDPEAGATWMKAHPGYGNPEWQTRLCSFPDTWAAGRWSRLMHYMGIQHLLGRTRDFENNYDDLEYAFFASYFGRLVTHDARLKRMTQLCFPSVLVAADLRDF